MDLIEKYFPGLNNTQLDQFRQLGPLYREWNEKINVISRKDIHHLYEHHILHSLSVAKVVSFKPDAHILDLGTGGGFPGIPLAILFPQSSFTLIDGTRKKITVVNEISDAIGLANVRAMHIRAEELKGQFDFVLSRAVAPLDKLARWSLRMIKEKQQHALPNGLLALKGGNIKEELNNLGRGAYSEVFPISGFFDLPYFEEKFIIYTQW